MLFSPILSIKNASVGRIGAGAVDQEMLEKNFRVAPFARRPFVLPEKAMK